MPTDRVAAFTVELTRYLDADGHKLGPLPEFAANPVDLVPLYQAMVLTRTFDAKAVALQRTGRLGTCIRLRDARPRRLHPWPRHGHRRILYGLGAG